MLLFSTRSWPHCQNHKLDSILNGCWPKCWNKPKMPTHQIWTFYVRLFSKHCSLKLTNFLLLLRGGLEALWQKVKIWKAGFHLQYFKSSYYTVLYDSGSLLCFGNSSALNLWELESCRKFLKFRFYLTIPPKFPKEKSLFKGKSTLLHYILRTKRCESSNLVKLVFGSVKNFFEKNLTIKGSELNALLLPAKIDFA